MTTRFDTFRGIKNLVGGWNRCRASGPAERIRLAERPMTRLPLADDGLEMSIPVLDSTIAAVEAAIVKSKLPKDIVAAILAAMDAGEGYDSIEREALFALAAKRTGLSYDAFYWTWMAVGS